MRRRLPPPWALTALAALVYALATPPTTDLAAQAHRVALARDGVWLFDLSWFGGHHLPGYSVLMPVLGLVLGPALITGLSAVAAAWAFCRLATRTWPGTGGTIAAWWFAAGVGGLQFTGRTTFLLGAALALVTLLVARPGAPAHDAGARRAPWSEGGARDQGPGPGRPVVRAAAGAAGAVLTALASPVAALFLAMIAGAWWLSRLRRLGGPGGDAVVPAVVAGVALLAAAALSAAFPTGGSEPFVASALWPAVVVLAVVLVLLPPEQRALRIGVAIYLVGVLLAGALPTPMGGNATRLAALTGGPVVAAALWGRRPVALAVLALPLVWWQWYPPVRDASQAWGDPSARASYWAPVADDLRARLEGAPGRVEVVPTIRRGEARWMPPAVPIARGWIRQLDRDRSPLFYADLDGPPTPASYRAWLDDEAISWVVLTDAEADHAAEDEAALLRAGRVPGLRRVARGAHWTVWRVEAARPVVGLAGRRSHADATGRAAADGSGRPAAPGAGGTRAPTSGSPHPDHGPADRPRVAAETASTLTVRTPPRALLDVRIRWSPYLRARESGVCITRGAGGWTTVRAGVHDTVTLHTALAVPWRRPDPQDCDR